MRFGRPLAGRLLLLLLGTCAIRGTISFADIPVGRGKNIIYYSCWFIILHIKIRRKKWEGSWFRVVSSTLEE